jgi:transcriptional regulator with XRE-family HTH domain
VNEQRRDGVNRWEQGDAHDVYNRERFQADLWAALVRRRQVSGLTLDRIAKSGGVTETTLNELAHSATSPIGSWKWDTVIGICRAVLVLPALKVVGFDASSVMWQAAQTNPDLLGVGAIDLMMCQRIHNGQSRTEIAELLGVQRGVVWEIEHSDNPRLSTIQRYARALRGRVEFKTKGFL